MQSYVPPHIACFSFTYYNQVHGFKQLIVTVIMAKKVKAPCVSTRKEKYSHNGIALRRVRLPNNSAYCKCGDCFYYKKPCLLIPCWIFSVKDKYTHYIFVKKT